jgi:hypothetical protein
VCAPAKRGLWILRCGQPGRAHPICGWSNSWGTSYARRRF